MMPKCSSRNFDKEWELVLNGTKAFRFGSLFSQPQAQSQVRFVLEKLQGLKQAYLHADDCCNRCKQLIQQFSHIMGLVLEDILRKPVIGV
jgi:hypothetical protein